jgi:hypothetical protein
MDRAITHPRKGPAMGFCASASAAKTATALKNFMIATAGRNQIETDRSKRVWLAFQEKSDWKDASRRKSLIIPTSSGEKKEKECGGRENE